MKYVNKLWLLVAAAGFVACAETDVDDYAVEKPENVSQYEQLFDYDGLKTYVNRTTDPNFKMGGGVTASEFTKKELVYALAKVNYDEVTAGNAMKYASCVNEKGEMDFSSVNAFISAAKDAGLTIYGHTLAWHAQQQPKYLNGLLADKELPVEPVDPGEANKYIEYTCGDAGANSWDKQATYMLPVSLEQGANYTITVDVKASAAPEGEGVGLWPIWSTSENKDQWGNSADVQYLPTYPVSDKWTTLTWVFDANFPHDKLQFVFGKFSGTVGFDNLSVVKTGTTDELVKNGDFAEEKTAGWGNNWNGPSFAIATEAAAMVKTHVVKFDFEDGNKPGGNGTFNIAAEGPEGSNCMVIDNPAKAANPWDVQVQLVAPYELDKAYTLEMKIKGSVAADKDIYFSYENPGWSSGGDLAVTTEWKSFKKVITFTEAKGNININIGNYVGKVWFDDIEIYTESAAAEPFSWVNVIKNSDCEGEDASNFVTKTNIGADAGNMIPSSFTEAGGGADGTGRAVIVEAGAMVEQPWDNQFFITSEHVFEEGDEYRFSMKVKAAKEASVGTQAHNAPGAYNHYAMIGNINFTTEWTAVEVSGKVDGSQAANGGLMTIAFNLNDFADANTYYFDDIVWEYKHNGNTIPLTPEEKKENLTKAMEAWIAGMMNACGGYVTSWDVVNEAISGGNPDGEGVYALQHDNGDKNNFFWQDYLGDEDYVRIAVRAARESFAASLPEGSTVTPADLKLFVNDYNLESDWDNNQKLKSLIAWIGRWEADGVTKIDGIGTQMHISYYEDAATQQSKQAAIENMFRLLAASGKLVKITELDMGYVKKGESDGAKTEDLTYEQHQQMAEYYKFIVKKYFEIIPAAQRYGITNWAITDSPADSGWRGGEPIGLWDKNYLRKPAFAGFADGLAGK